MTNFDILLFGINDIEDHENNINVRQIRRREIISDPFLLSDRLFVTNSRLTKNIVKYLIELLRHYIITNSRSFAIDLNTKVGAISSLAFSRIIFIFFLLFHVLLTINKHIFIYCSDFCNFEFFRFRLISVSY